jgi:hypothetical protein
VESALQTDEVGIAELSVLVDIVRDWLRSKGLEALPDTAVRFGMPDGREAGASAERAAAGQDAAWDIALEEPTESGRFLTRICLGVRQQSLYVFVELRAGTEGLKLRPVPVDARCPHVLRSILDQRVWFVGATPARTKPLPLIGAAGGRRLMAVVRHTDRNLPVVAVSTHEGNQLTSTFADDLARDLSGVAVVAALDQAAAWEISLEFGREWSCYNGAVRMYWPLRSASSSVNALEHPLWTRERLLSTVDDPKAAASRLRHQLRRQLLALSTYTVSEPALLMRVFAEAAEARLQELRESASSVDDWVNIAEEYARENTVLKVQKRELEEQRSQLQAQVENLSIALQYQESAETEATIAPEAAPLVRSVVDAVVAATQRYADDLVFGADVANSVRAVAQDAGPPDKIYEYLKGLAEMTRQRRGPGLGRDMLMWLREQGLKASGESETVLNNHVEMLRRTWDDGIGGRRRFECHLKPSEGTSPDRCVRIYFAYDEAVQKTIIGWVGRHP